MGYKSKLIMENSNTSIVAMSDKALLQLLGNYIKESRIRQNKTQQEVAVTAGINRSTLVQIEGGGGGHMLTFIQILRAIDQLYILKSFEIENQISPVALAKLQLAKRQRASQTKT